MEPISCQLVIAIAEMSWLKAASQSSSQLKGTFFLIRLCSGQATREVLHKSPVIGRQPAERPDFQNVRWPWPTDYGGYLVRIAFDPLVTDNMAKKGHLMLKQIALSWLEFQCVIIDFPNLGLTYNGGWCLATETDETLITRPSCEVNVK